MSDRNGGQVLDDRLLELEEVAERLGVSVYTVSGWCRSHRIPAVKLGRRWVIPERRLQEWLDRGGTAQAI